MTKAPFIYTAIVFLYIVALPFYGTYLIPVVRTFVFIPFACLIIVDKLSRYIVFFKYGVVKMFLAFMLYGLSTCLLVASTDAAMGQFSDYVTDFIFLFTFITASSRSIVLLKPIFYALAIGLFLSIFLGILQHYNINIIKIQSDESINSNTVENDILRSSGPFGNSLTYSNYLSVVGIIVSLTLLMFRTRKFISLSIITYLLTSLALIYSGGRTGIVAFQIAYLIGFIFYTPNKMYVVLGLVILIGVGGYFSTELLRVPTIQRFFNSSDDLKDIRWKNNWAYGLRIFDQSPYFGTGMGNLNFRLTEMHHPYVPSSRKFAYNGHVESVFLTILATYGLIGFLIFLSWIITIIINFIRTMSTFRGTKFFDYLVACLFAFLVFLVNMITNPALIFDLRIMFLFMALGSSSYIISNYFVKKTFIVKT